MGVEDEIRALLARGNSPQDVIRQGYRKSTVYKVYANFTAEAVPVTPPAWWINWQTQKQRYLPGETVALGYSIKNTSGMDLYIYKSGIQPEWLERRWSDGHWIDGHWYTQEVRFLLRPGENRNLAVNVPIPSDLALGEYEMRWGLDAQFVGPGAPVSSSTIQTQWTEPFVLEVKKPLTGYKVFISHSTADMYLVRQLQHSLDNEGIEGMVAEDTKEPGAVLQEKFESQIRECHFFLALLTANGARSAWVIRETNYALSMSKPLILLKEKETQIDSPVEWVEFSRYDSPEAILSKAQEALQMVKQRHYSLTPPPNLAPLVIGVLAFLFGLAAGKSKGQEK